MYIYIYIVISEVARLDNQIIRKKTLSVPSPELFENIQHSSKSLMKDCRIAIMMLIETLSGKLTPKCFVFGGDVKRSLHTVDRSVTMIEESTNAKNHNCPTRKCLPKATIPRERSAYARKFLPGLHRIQMDLKYGQYGMDSSAKLTTKCQKKHLKILHKKLI